MARKKHHRHQGVMERVRRVRQAWCAGDLSSSKFRDALDSIERETGKKIDEARLLLQMARRVGIQQAQILIGGAP